MPDQADKLRQLVRKTIKSHPSLEPGVPLVVLNGGNQGVGTTTVAIHLVQELAQLGKRAILVDANLQQPNIATQMGVDARGSLTEVLDGSRSAVEVLETINQSIRLLAGRWTPAAPPRISQEAVSRLVTELRTLHNQADIVILDAGSGMSPWTAELWRAAQQVLLVSTPDSTAAMDSYAAVKLSPYAELGSKLRFLVNQCDDLDLAQQMGNRFASTCRQFLDLRVHEVVAVASNTATNASGQLRTDSRQQSKAFKQSVRLLAAEVLNSCLVLSKPSSTRQKNSSQKMIKSTNKTQSDLLR